MKLIEYLGTDEELKNFREKWKTKFTEPFPPYNYDCYGGIDDYKIKIKAALESGDYTKANGNIRSKFFDTINKEN